MVFYNALLAFVLMAICYAVGEWVATATKAWVPSVFASAILYLFGYWTFFPKTIGTDSGLVPFAATVAMMLLIVHIGTIISVKHLLEQWKTIVVCLAGLAGMVLFSWYLAPLFMDKTLMIAGLPPLTGGIVAATTMQMAAHAKGLEVAATFAVTIYCVQGFAGYPLTAIMLHKFGNKELAKLRSGEIVLTEEQKEANRQIGMTVVNDDSKVKKLLPRVPDKYNTPVFMLCKLGLVAWFASLAGQLKFGSVVISPAIWALVFGVIFCAVGFLDTNILNRANSYWISMFALMMIVFDGLKNLTPAMLKSIIGPMVILIVIGVVGMAVFSFIIAKVFKMSFYLAFANGLTALYGFPADAIISESTCEALSDDPDEVNYLMSKIFPSMIVGGFTTVTITSVFLAGIFATLL